MPLRYGVVHLTQDTHISKNDTVLARVLTDNTIMNRGGQTRAHIT